MCRAQMDLTSRAFVVGPRDGPAQTPSGQRGRRRRTLTGAVIARKILLAKGSHVTVWEACHKLAFGYRPQAWQIRGTMESMEQRGMGHFAQILVNNGRNKTMAFVKNPPDLMRGCLDEFDITEAHYAERYHTQPPSDRRGNPYTRDSSGATGEFAALLDSVDDDVP